MHKQAIPENIESRPLLRQAKIVSQKLKETIHKERYETFISKPQHGLLFQQMIDKNYDMKTCLSWVEKCHLSPQSIHLWYTGAGHIHEMA